MKQRLTLLDLLCAALALALLWGLASLFLLFGPGNCYDAPQFCGVTENSR